MLVKARLFPFDGMASHPILRFSNNFLFNFQYFLWYLSLLPLILPQVNINLTKAFKMLLAWCLSQVTIHNMNTKKTDSPLILTAFICLFQGSLVICCISARISRLQYVVAGLEC
jgi:hypothetical protein